MSIERPSSHPCRRLSTASTVPTPRLKPYWLGGDRSSQPKLQRVLHYFRDIRKYCKWAPAHNPAIIRLFRDKHDPAALPGSGEIPNFTAYVNDPRQVCQPSGGKETDHVTCDTVQPGSPALHRQDRALNLLVGEIPKLKTSETSETVGTTIKPPGRRKRATRGGSRGDVTNYRGKIVKLVSS